MKDIAYYFSSSAPSSPHLTVEMLELLTFMIGMEDLSS